jgi:hypothetical protein
LGVPNEGLGTLMSDYGVLTKIVAQHSLPPEPVATGAFVHIIQSFEVAAEALDRLAAEICPGIPVQGLRWRGQAMTREDTSIPDADAVDDVGDTRIVLEAKFDAELTPAQLGTAYLDRLPRSVPGLLVYVVPSDRIPAVWPKLLAGPAQTTPVVPEPSDSARPWMAHSLPDGRAVAIVSWPTVLGRLASAAKDSGDAAFLCDVAQLDGLVRWRTRHQWTPIAAGDLSSRIARQIDGLRRCIVDAAKAARTSGARVEGGGTTDSGTGRWIETPGRLRIWVGIWPMMWGRHDVSPIWLGVERDQQLAGAHLQETLRTIAAPVGCAVYPWERGWAIPLVVPMSAELSEMIDSLSLQVRRAVEALDAALRS